MLFNIPLNLNLLFYNKNFSRKNIAHCKCIERFNLYTSNRTEQFSLSLKACLETGPCVTKPREIFLNELFETLLYFLLLIVYLVFYFLKIVFYSMNCGKNMYVTPLTVQDTVGQRKNLFLDDNGRICTVVHLLRYTVPKRI